MTATASGWAWLSTAQDIGTLIITVFGIITAAFTAWWAYERARKMRKDRQD